jgi:hypothetical protein
MKGYKELIPVNSMLLSTIACSLLTGTTDSAVKADERPPAWRAVRREGSILVFR